MKIKTRIFIKIALRVLLLIFVAAALCGIYMYYRPFLKDSSKGIYAIPSFAVLYLIFIIRTRSVKMFLDRSWVGEIISVTTVVAPEPITFSVAISRRPVKNIPYSVVKIRKENGETVTLKIQSRKMSASLFKVGDRIKHYKATAYPILLDPHNPDLHFCPLCGRDLNNPYCPDCRVKF